MQYPIDYGTARAIQASRLAATRRAHRVRQRGSRSTLWRWTRRVEAVQPCASCPAPA